MQYRYNASFSDLIKSVPSSISSISSSLLKLLSLAFPFFFVALIPVYFVQMVCVCCIFKFASYMSSRFLLFQVIVYLFVCSLSSQVFSSSSSFYFFVLCLAFLFLTPVFFFQIIQFQTCKLHVLKMSPLISSRLLFSLYFLSLSSHCLVSSLVFHISFCNFIHSFIALCVSVTIHAVFFFLNPLLIHIYFFSHMPQ